MDSERLFRAWAGHERDCDLQGQARQDCLDDIIERYEAMTLEWRERVKSVTISAKATPTRKVSK